MYIKVNDDGTTVWPYTIDQLRQRQPQRNFMTPTTCCLTLVSTR